MTAVTVNTGTNKKRRKHLRPKPLTPPTPTIRTESIHPDTGRVNHPKDNIIHNTPKVVKHQIGYSNPDNVIKLASKESNVVDASYNANNTTQPNKRHKSTTDKINNDRYGKLPSKSIPMPPATDGISQLYNTDMTHHELCNYILEWLIYPLSIQQFYTRYYECKPFVIHRYKSINPQKCKLVTVKHSYITDYVWYEQQRNNNLSVSDNNRSIQYYTLNNPINNTNDITEHYYDNIFSKQDIDDILHHRNTHGGVVQYTSDIDITQYKNYIRHTLNPTGKVNAKQVWNLYNDDKCSIRFLCPHKYNTTLHRLINLLDTHFGMGVGANSYLTPAGSQGFAPHYDDVDVFVLQTEGSKRWRLYAPIQQSDILSQHSSRNYTQEEIGDPILDVVLNEGDFLYAPRGTIHQCVASETEHSLHVTLSTCLKSSWGEYLSTLLPLAVQNEFNHNIQLRRTLPHQYAMYTGSQHSGENNEMQQQMQSKALELLHDIIQRPLPIDAAADQMALTYMHYRVPPCITDTKHSYQAMIDSNKITSTDDLITKSIIQPHTRIRLVQPNIARLVIDDSMTNINNLVQLHHIAGNSVEHMSVPLTCLDFSSNLTPALELILLTHPLYITVESLPLPPEYDENNQLIECDIDEDNQLRIQLVAALFADGIVELTNDKHVPDSTKQLISTTNSV